MNENFINKTKQPFTVFENEILQKETIFKNANQKMCYFYLYSLRSYNVTFPSHETISTAVCCSVSTVKRILVDLESLGLLEIKSRPGYTSIYTLNDYHEVVQNELGQNRVAQNELGGRSKRAEEIAQNELRGRSKRATKTNELKKNDIKSNNIKTTSRSLDINIDGYIDKELKSKYPDLPYDIIKYEMLKDESLVIKTDKQYKSMLKYRLANYQPFKMKSGTKQSHSKVEVIPEWFKNDKITEKQGSSLLIDEERQKLLIELGIIELQA